MFQRIVKATHMSANLDDPEGGFDAIVQVLACKVRYTFNTETHRPNLRL